MKKHTTLKPDVLPVCNPVVDSPLLRVAILFFTVSLWVSPGFDMVAEAAPQVTRQPRVYKMHITPHWIDDGTRFWYRNDLPNNEREFVLVDVVQGTRRLAFDHAAVARQLGSNVNPKRLPIESLNFDMPNNRIWLIGITNQWILDISTGKVTPATNSQNRSFPNQLPRTFVPRPTSRTGAESHVVFINQTTTEVKLFWIDFDGIKHLYAIIKPGDTHLQHTFGGHMWLVTSKTGELLGVFEASDLPSVAIISTDQSISTNQFRDRKISTPPDYTNSSGHQLNVKIKDHNLWLKDQEGNEYPLTCDGCPTNYYSHFVWAPGFTHIVAWRLEPGDTNEVYLIQSSPPGGGRAKLERRPYPTPGDKFPRYELTIVCVTNKSILKPAVERFEHVWERPKIHWEKDGLHFTWWQVDRGHQRARILEANVLTGNVRTIFEERSPTFIWTAHTESMRLQLVNWLTNTDEIIYVSELSGWRHLYLIDIKSGSVSPITQGEWVVRGIDFIDETNRLIWFSASGREPNQDPYFLHHYKVNFDGSNLVRLTEGIGTHTIQFSPDRCFIIDTCSRVDLPPIHQLRRTSDGTLVCELDRADASELLANGWTPPLVFTAKGRDNKTDIWGIIYKPKNFTPTKKYTVIEQIYAGPQGYATPKSFSEVINPPPLTELGYVVVQIDGMGTAHRSKRFHEVCWRNLRDAGFPDRVLWHKAAAATFPWYDMSRGVGIYGVSAGGQNAVAALLWHNDLYKVAVAACGCHDNRLDKASWNEQWMGYMPPDQIWVNSPTNWYAQNSNIENASLLQGHLLLIVGELDRNVPPESTLRLANALIQAGKDFDLIVIPNAGHGLGGSFGERKMKEFFLRHLPPNK